MTPQPNTDPFIKWIREQIDMHERHYRLSPKYDRDEYRRGAADALEDAKNKYLQLSSQGQDTDPDNENSFTNGLT